MIEDRLRRGLQDLVTDGRATPDLLGGAWSRARRRRFRQKVAAIAVVATLAVVVGVAVAARGPGTSSTLRVAGPSPTSRPAPPTTLYRPATTAPAPAVGVPPTSLPCLSLPPPQTVAADLDGDGRPDSITFTPVAPPGAPCYPFGLPDWHIAATLATGATLTLSLGGYQLADLNGTVALGAVRLGPGRQQQLLVRGGGNDSALVSILVVSRGALTLIDAVPSGGQSLEYSVKGHNCCPFFTADLTCPAVAGAPAVEQTSSVVAPAATGPHGQIDPQQVYGLSQSDPAKLRRYWTRTIYRLQGDQLVTVINDSGAIAFGAPAPAGVPLSNTLSCQGTIDPNG